MAKSQGGALFRPSGTARFAMVDLGKSSGMEMATSTTEILSLPSRIRSTRRSKVLTFHYQHRAQDANGVTQAVN